MGMAALLLLSVEEVEKERKRAGWHYVTNSGGGSSSSTEGPCATHGAMKPHLKAKCAYKLHPDSTVSLLNFWCELHMKRYSTCACPAPLRIGNCAFGVVRLACSPTS